MHGMTAGTVIPINGWRKPFVPPAPASDPIYAPERGLAVHHLRGVIRRHSIVYAVLRRDSPANDWLICDLYLVEGHAVTRITDDVAHATGTYDPEREVGLKLDRPPGSRPLLALIEGSLSRALFGESGQISHGVIG
jgi:hypothetical protein